MHTGAEASCKTVFVLALLDNLVAEGHRTLVFSQSRVMLDILQAAIKQRKWRFLRIDGSVASATDRAVGALPYSPQLAYKLAHTLAS